jgi:hypothetical protein
MSGTWRNSPKACFRWYETRYCRYSRTSVQRSRRSQTTRPSQRLSGSSLDKPSASFSQSGVGTGSSPTSPSQQVLPLRKPKQCEIMSRITRPTSMRSMKDLASFGPLSNKQAEIPETGVLRPYRISRAEYDTWNPTFLQGDAWPMALDADPDAGWSHEQIMSGAPKAAGDYTGAQFFMLRDLLSKFCQRVKCLKLKFRMYYMDARDLPMRLTFWKEEVGVYDRVEVSPCLHLDLYCNVRDGALTFSPDDQRLRLHIHRPNRRHLNLRAPPQTLFRQPPCNLAPPLPKRGQRCRHPPPHPARLLDARTALQKPRAVPPRSKSVRRVRSSRAPLHQRVEQINEDASRFRSPV